MIKDKKVLVVSAHAADYVWRSGGTIAKYIKHGAEVHVVVLSFGIRGESAAQWRKTLCFSPACSITVSDTEQHRTVGLPWRFDHHLFPSRKKPEIKGRKAC